MTPAQITAAVLTVSDRCHAGEARDTSGPALCALLERRLKARVAASACLPDDVEAIADQLRLWAHRDPRPDLILTSGGTGLAPRDVTPEATLAVLERRHDALIQLIHLRCYSKTPYTFLSRGVAGTAGRSLILNLPGSERGATQALEALLDVLPHAVEQIRGAGGKHEKGTEDPGAPGEGAAGD